MSAFNGLKISAAILGETNIVDPIQDAVKALSEAALAHEMKLYNDIFGPGAPLEGLQEDFEIEIHPPEIYTSSDNFGPDCINFGIRTKYRVIRRRKEEDEA